MGSIFSKIKKEFQVCDIQKSLERVGWIAELAQEEKKAKNLYDVCLRHSEIENPRMGPSTLYSMGRPLRLPYLIGAPHMITKRG